MPEQTGEAPERGANRERRSVIALLLAGAVALLIAVGSAAISIGSINDNTRAVEHTLQAQAAIGDLATQAERIETARRGYLIEPGESFRVIIRGADGQFDASLATLTNLIADNSVQTARIGQLTAFARERDVLLEALFADGGRTDATRSQADFERDRGVVLIRQTRTTLDQMMGTEQQLLRQRNVRQGESLLRFYIVGGLALALLVVMMVAAIVIVMRYNRDLTLTQTRLRLVNDGLEEAVSARTSELSRANDEIQRFAYIVSHDLRSPLVNVLGFTSELDEARKALHRHLSQIYEDQPDLRDEAAWLAVDEDLPEALGFIRTSTEKMDRLINSILELSRQGRRTLTPERLDMTVLAENVASTMHQRAEAAGAEVTVSPVPDLESDRIAVEQIVANLVENALKYLSPARSGVVSVEGCRNGRNVEVSVIDNGRGIAPADQERIFELFRRAGTQDQPGEGIGLANVRALAYRLGGRITVESELNKGSRFTLILPEKFVVETVS